MDNCAQIPVSPFSSFHQFELATIFSLQAKH
jgi:hypothetical protein